MKNLDHVFSFSEAFQEIKHQYISGNDETGFEPSFTITSVTDGTAFVLDIYSQLLFIMVPLLLKFSLLGYIITLLVAWILLRKRCDKSYRDQYLKICTKKKVLNNYAVVVSFQFWCRRCRTAVIEIANLPRKDFKRQISRLNENLNFLIAKKFRVIANV